VRKEVYFCLKEENLVLKANLKVEKENLKAKKKRNDEARLELFRMRREKDTSTDEVEDKQDIQALVK
jgi:hypothetical protein